MQGTYLGPAGTFQNHWELLQTESSGCRDNFPHGTSRTSLGGWQVDLPAGSRAQGRAAFMLQSEGKATGDSLPKGLAERQSPCPRGVPQPHAPTPAPGMLRDLVLPQRSLRVPRALADVANSASDQQHQTNTNSSEFGVQFLS